MWAKLHLLLNGTCILVLQTLINIQALARPGSHHGWHGFGVGPMHQSVGTPCKFQKTYPVKEVIGERSKEIEGVCHSLMKWRSWKENEALLATQSWVSWE